MTQGIPYQNAENLMLLYQQIDQELTGCLLEGASWEEQKNRIVVLAEISKELSRRKIEINKNDGKPKEGSKGTE